MFPSSRICFVSLSFVGFIPWSFETLHRHHWPQHPVCVRGKTSAESAYRTCDYIDVFYGLTEAVPTFWDHSSHFSCRRSWKNASNYWMTTNTVRFQLECLTIRWVYFDVDVVKDTLKYWMMTCNLTCAAVGSPEDQAGEWFPGHESTQLILHLLWSCDSMTMMSCSVHTGHHSSWHRREDLHAISNVRYDLRWRSLPDVLKLLHHLSVFLHRKSFLGLCRLCTIWNTDCKSHMKLIHFNHACHRSWLSCAAAHSHSCVWGWKKWDFGLILPQNKLLFPRSHLGHWSSSPKSDSGVYHYMAGTVKTQPIVKPLHLL